MKCNEWVSIEKSCVIWILFMAIVYDKIKEKLTSHFLIQLYFIFIFYWIIIALHTVLGALEKRILKTLHFWLKTQHWKNEVMASAPITSWQIDEEKVKTVKDFICLGLKIIVDSDYSHEIKRCLLPGRKANRFRQHIVKQRHNFSNKVSYSQSYGFSSSHVQMWELDHKEHWALKNWCFQIVVLEDSWESLG